jgi:hypothetical protein
VLSAVQTTTVPAATEAAARPRPTRRTLARVPSARPEHPDSAGAGRFDADDGERGTGREHGEWRRTETAIGSAERARLEIVDGPAPAWRGDRDRERGEVAPLGKMNGFSYGNSCQEGRGLLAFASRATDRRASRLGGGVVVRVAASGERTKPRQEQPADGERLVGRVDSICVGPSR